MMRIYKVVIVSKPETWEVFQDAWCRWMTGNSAGYVQGSVHSGEPEYVEPPATPHFGRLHYLTLKGAEWKARLFESWGMTVRIDVSKPVEWEGEILRESQEEEEAEEVEQ